MHTDKCTDRKGTKLHAFCPRSTPLRPPPTEGNDHRSVPLPRRTPSCRRLFGAPVFGHHGAVLSTPVRGFRSMHARLYSLFRKIPW